MLFPACDVHALQQQVIVEDLEEWSFTDLYIEPCDDEDDQMSSPHTTLLPVGDDTSEGSPSHPATYPPEPEQRSDSGEWNPM